MRLIRHLNSDREDLPATSVTVGNFDGLHRGHQALIDATRDGAGKLVPALMCFEPLPATFFKPEAPQPRLLSVRDRIRLVRDFGLELMFMPRFDAAFARQSPERFVRDVLVAGARAERVVVGADFRFGSRAAGDVAMLEKLGRRYGFSVERVEAVADGDERISSTRIRTAMFEGDLREVERLLGRPYRVSGRVLRGRALGRDLGFPTINIRPPMPPALTGILAVRVSGDGLDAHPGVASLGRRPVLGGTDWLLEVHLFDYDDHLYGKHLEVEFVEFIRNEEHFDDLETLTEQMKKDAEKARNVLARQ
ncbi:MULTISPECIES: bifunctional riboflavin kinase/FAD synthetase [unclassified Wenzhouxiangella]|uniref:bifunctional riboflavin kinase/FAD synthetase n=1 Tax=unclassified Wenzhouxiangella TaxID=2613841 RepID=UPI000E328EBC|nr:MULTISPECIES: bifunctional riboflavin kinase/FAD synthetase [unclassified Wenzhouxiangella]RFF27810.1 bifunctional riboflavin kinase/FAD synthetase [Wenzhouxiangella sp. 15181]RFP70347.1 bifunctional riboflavin kinase/FAD synthetase [Wenzhouxiangella sp. 15190]